MVTTLFKSPCTAPTRYSCQILIKLDFKSTNFQKILKYQISWKSVRWETSCSMRTGGKTWRSYSRFSLFFVCAYKGASAGGKFSQKHNYKYMAKRWCLFIHLAVCLTTGPKPLPNRALHIVRSTASSFNCEYPLLSLRSSSSFPRFLRLPVTSIPPFIFSSITRCRRQFLRKMWPIQLAFRFLISCRIFLCSLTLSNTSSFLTRSVQLIFSILLQHHISKLSRCFWSTARSVQVSAPYKAMLQMQHFTSFFLNPKSNVLVKRALFLLNAALAIAILLYLYIYISIYIQLK